MEPDFSIVSTPIENVPFQFALAKFISQPVQKELDVDDKDIKPLTEKGTEKVKVGDLVRIYISEK